MDRVYVMKLVRAYQCGFISRRDFVARAAAALGSLAAANTLAAACVPVPTAVPPVVQETQPAANPTPEAIAEGELITEVAQYPNADGEILMGYLARPTTDDRHPAVIVIQEWWGVDDHIKEVTRRLAREGFVALAPDLYHGVVVTEPDEARKLVMELDMDEAVREIQQAITFLRGQEYVAGPKVGVIGFCMGGRLALMTARVENQLGAVIAFYGSPLKPEEATEVKAPILGLYGAADQGISVESVRAMEAALQEAGIESEFHIYEGAGHAFFNDTRPSYHREAAADAWPRALSWLRAHLIESG